MNTLQEVAFIMYQIQHFQISYQTFELETGRHKAVIYRPFDPYGNDFLSLHLGGSAPAIDGAAPCWMDGFQIGEESRRLMESILNYRSMLGGGLFIKRVGFMVLCIDQDEEARRLNLFKSGID